MTGWQRLQLTSQNDILGLSFAFCKAAAASFILFSLNMRSISALSADVKEIMISIS